MKGCFEQVLPEWLEHDCEGMEWTVRVHGASWLAQGSVQRAFKLALVADSGTNLQLHVRQAQRHATILPLALTVPPCGYIQYMMDDPAIQQVAVLLVCVVSGVFAVG